MATELRIPFSLDVVIPRILEIGMAEAPREACGVIIPDLNSSVDGWIHQLVNRAENPYDSYVIDPRTITDLLKTPEAWEGSLIWHTHPGGHVGPSQGDMRARHPELKYLVVTLPRGEATLF